MDPLLLIETVVADLAGSMPFGLGAAALQSASASELTAKLRPYCASYAEMVRLYPDRRGETDARYAQAVQQLAAKYVSSMLGVEPGGLVVVAVTAKALLALKQHRAWPELVREYSFLALL